MKVAEGTLEKSDLEEQEISSIKKEVTMDTETSTIIDTEISTTTTAKPILLQRPSSKSPIYGLGQKVAVAEAVKVYKKIGWILSKIGWVLYQIGLYICLVWFGILGVVGVLLVIGIIGVNLYAMVTVAYIFGLNNIPLIIGCVLFVIIIIIIGVLMLMWKIMNQLYAYLKKICDVNDIDE